ncbi:DNA polymerase III subunit delta' [Cochlodiniinecator piscidefendens]|uniref:DNA polymerase III subunit delta' n=1 Tax=Cochlodiniinecator piscidefendens TaxID=2715756 RepID=UPI001409CCBA|nr:DNA polymerase III subunit delta' [Cochlodiniinecator piscidefendens]
MNTDLAPEADCVTGAPHPRETQYLMGHAAEEAAFLDAYNSGRLHHAWMITGPRGIGKATLAWKIARFLLTQPMGSDAGLFGEAPAPTDLSTDPDHPVSHRVNALSEPRLYLLRRPWDKDKDRHKQDITVDEVRGLKGFFAMSAADGGRRVVIVDSVDEMNPSAANALLKVLEEPPKDTTLLLIGHQPSRLLPTIKSRCRTLRLSPLTPEDMGAALSGAGAAPTDHASALAALTSGSVGDALRLMTLSGLETYQQIVLLFSALPKLDRQHLTALAESVTGKGTAERYDLLLGLVDLFLARIAKTGAMGQPQMPEAAEGEANLMMRLAPNPQAGRAWAELQQSLGARVRHGKSVNLDPAALILDMGLKIDETAAKWAAR